MCFLYHGIISLYVMNVIILNFCCNPDLQGEGAVYPKRRRARLGATLQRCRFGHLAQVSFQVRLSNTYSVPSEWSRSYLIPQPVWRGSDVVCAPPCLIASQLLSVSTGFSGFFPAELAWWVFLVHAQQHTLFHIRTWKSTNSEGMQND